MKRLFLGLIGIIGLGACAAQSDSDTLEENENIVDSQEAASATQVEWSGEDTLEYTISYGTALDWGFEYTTATSSKKPLLFLQTCENEEPCYTSALSDVDGEGMIRYGIDITQYQLGLNTYKLKLYLKDGKASATDLLTLNVTVTP